MELYPVELELLKVLRSIAQVVLNLRGRNVPKKRKCCLVYQLDIIAVEESECNKDINLDNLLVIDDLPIYLVNVQIVGAQHFGQLAN